MESVAHDCESTRGFAGTVEKNLVKTQKICCKFCKNAEALNEP